MAHREESRVDHFVVHAKDYDVSEKLPKRPTKVFAALAVDVPLSRERSRRLLGLQRGRPKDEHPTNVERVDYVREHRVFIIEADVLEHIEHVDAVVVPPREGVLRNVRSLHTLREIEAILAGRFDPLRIAIVEMKIDHLLRNHP